MEEHLNQFTINFSQDGIALVTDGAEVMKCLGRKIGCYHLLCMCHGIHLAVIDVLYPKKKDQPQLPVLEGYSQIDEVILLKIFINPLILSLL